MDRKKLIEFEYEGKKFAIVSPTQEELLRMDMEYRQAFSNAVRKGLMTEFEAKRVFEKIGTWTEDNDKEITGLQMQIVALELELEKEEDLKKGRELAFEIMNLRNKLMDLVHHKSRLFSAQTAEGYADAIKMSAFTYECAVDEGGQKVFPTKEAFCGHQDTSFTATCYSKAMLADMGMSEEDTQLVFNERKWLEEHDLLEEGGQFTQKYYEELIKENEVVDEAKKEETPAKPRAKKKVAKKTKKRRTKKKVK